MAELALVVAFSVGAILLTSIVAYRDARTVVTKTNWETEPGHWGVLLAIVPLAGPVVYLYKRNCAVNEARQRLDEFDTTKKHVVRTLLYAALLSLVVSRELLSLIIEHADDDLVFPPERWAATFRSHAQLILYRLSDYLGNSPPPLLDRLINDTQKIHKQRPVLQEQLATTIEPAAEA
ncbi:hypothetical protein SAMN05421752_11547 [Natronorubrum thiooxidans]|uniref:Uncharacterized protein n=1 Tax=Natronorubrum thiooxidans TaxID=308853 RepID=A0A1N7GTR4_9EURY|nr:hypothetical protein SAMN05421752_11547 [Natronorubrum thiooxidans]